MNKLTNNHFIKMLQENDELETSEKVMLAINMSPLKDIKNELVKSSMLSQVGITGEPSKIDQFVYVILNIARPDIFESET